MGEWMGGPVLGYRPLGNEFRAMCKGEGRVLPDVYEKHNSIPMLDIFILRALGCASETGILQATLQYDGCVQLFVPSRNWE